MVADLIIFDCDGVLVDSEIISCRCTAEVLSELGFDIGEETVLKRYVGISDRSMAARIEEEWGRPLPADFRREIQSRILRAFDTELRAIDDIAEALDTIAPSRCVASSGTSERIRRALTVTGLLDRLAPHLFSSSMVENGKPAPDLFLFAASEMQVAPWRCIVIEDSIAGVKAGKAAGMRVLGFTGASHVDPRLHAPRLLEAGADLTFQRMRDLPELLGAHETGERSGDR